MSELSVMLDISMILFLKYFKVFNLNPYPANTESD